MNALLLVLTCGVTEASAPPEPPPPAQDAPAEVPAGSPPVQVVVGPATEIAAAIVRERDAALIQRTLVERSGELKPCYDRLITGGHVALEGRVELTWTVSDSRVVSVEVVADTAGHPPLAECLKDKVQDMIFPGIEEAQITWPFVFEPADHSGVRSRTRSGR